MGKWFVYDEDGDVVDSVEAETAGAAIAQFDFAQSSWFAVPDGWMAISLPPGLTP